MTITTRESTTTIEVVTSLFDDGVLFASVEARVRRRQAGVSQLTVLIRYSGEPVGTVLTNRSMATRNKNGDEVDIVALREDVSRAESVAITHYKRAAPAKIADLHHTGRAVGSPAATPPH